MNQLFHLLAFGSSKCWIGKIANENALEYSSISIISFIIDFRFSVHFIAWAGWPACKLTQCERSQACTQLDCVHVSSCTFNIRCEFLSSGRLFFRSYLISTIVRCVFFILLSCAFSYSPCSIWICSLCDRISMAHSPHIVFRLKRLFFLILFSVFYHFYWIYWITDVTQTPVLFIQDWTMFCCS